MQCGLAGLPGAGLERTSFKCRSHVFHMCCRAPWSRGETGRPTGRSLLEISREEALVSLLFSGSCVSQCPKVDEEAPLSFRPLAYIAPFCAAHSSSRTGPSGLLHSPANPLHHHHAMQVREVFVGFPCSVHFDAGATTRMHCVLPHISDWLVVGRGSANTSRNIRT